MPDHNHDHSHDIPDEIVENSEHYTSSGRSVHSQPDFAHFGELGHEHEEEDHEHEEPDHEHEEEDEEHGHEDEEHHSVEGRSEELIADHAGGDHFEFTPAPEPDDTSSNGRPGDGPQSAGGAVAQYHADGRPISSNPPGAIQDPDDPEPPVSSPSTPDAPTALGRPAGTTPGTPQTTPQAPGPENNTTALGRPSDAAPDIPEPTGPLTTYTSGGPAASSYNVKIDFLGTWTEELQASFIDAADYLSQIILADIPDTFVNGTAIDDITITATLEAMDGVGGVLGSAGPRTIRGDGTYLTSTGAMTFDSADAQNQFNLGNWETIILHEMMHAMGFGTLWGLMGLTTGSVAGGDIRFTGENATRVYQTEFSAIANNDPESLSGIPVETDGGSGTAGGHWDEFLFQDEIMTGYVDRGAFVSVMTIAAFEDMGYDTVYDDPENATDFSGPIPVDPLFDLMV